MKFKIVVIVGARPNFIKAAPLLDAFSNYYDKIETFLIHTGQHYDQNLSKQLFSDLKMLTPDKFLGIGAGTHAVQTGKIMISLEKAFEEIKPGLIVVFGDVNSTLAAAIVAAKMSLPLAHIESGLRSFDKAMPEEINRIVTDRLSDLLFVSEKSGMDNLKNENVPDSKVFFTGNIMIDSLVKHLELAQQSNIHTLLNIKPGNYATLTMHRPSNVDDNSKLSNLLNCLTEISQKIPIIFPCHPRTKNRLESTGLNYANGNFKIVEPLGYINFLKLQSDSKFIITDSGGLQEESTFQKIPCITIRDNTERPSTIDVGTNVLTGPNPDKINSAVNDIMNNNFKPSRIPELWDGKTSDRITKIILNFIEGKQ